MISAVLGVDHENKAPRPLFQSVPVFLDISQITWNLKKTPWNLKKHLGLGPLPILPGGLQSCPILIYQWCLDKQGRKFQGYGKYQWEKLLTKLLQAKPTTTTTSLSSSSSSTTTTTTVSHTLQNGRQTSHRALSHANARNAYASFPSMTATAARKRILRRLAFDKSHDGLIAGYPVLNHAYLPLSCTEHGAYASHTTSTPHAKQDNQTTQTRITLLLQDTKDRSIEF